MLKLLRLGGDLVDISFCRLCPRKCGVDRTNGELGFCGAGKDAVIGLYSLHKWEEPCISGKNGSGTVFFSHCTMKCIFCQNYSISTEHHGRTVTADELCDIFLRLHDMGAHNINLVTPTHFLASIIPALEMAKSRGLLIPVIYNCGGYESIDTLSMLSGLIDIYMPDFKYWREGYATAYSNAPDYRETAKKALAEMFRQVGRAQFENGLMIRGMLVRHLLLPGLLYDAKKIIDYLYNTYGDSIYISIMNQYTPLPHISNIDALNRRVGKNEYDTLLNYATRIGVKNAFVQEEGSSNDIYIPDFYKK